MRRYGFADGNGYEISRGVRMLPSEVREYAQLLADTRGVSVDYWDEESPMNEDPSEGRVGLVTVEPAR